MRILVVGGTAVSGQAALQAGRAAGAYCFATSSDGRKVDLAQETAALRLDDGGADMDRFVKSLGGQTFDFLVYTPARGPVALPAREATKDMVEESLSFSVLPYLKLARALSGRVIALSGFVTMPPLLSIYGAMTFTKLTMENLAIAFPERFGILRAGMFLSRSVRGIALLVQRRMQRDPDAELQALRDEWKKVGGRFQDFFWNRNFQYEASYYGGHGRGEAFRPTEPEDLVRAFSLIFKGEKAPIVNVIGSWLWTDEQMPAVPTDLPGDLIRKDLWP
ncbi:MAG: hypothetical protein HS115_07375 [Spirochaetales bacterium]|nr:hypothetical protein [Spirochaetales bacterium]